MTEQATASGPDVLPLMLASSQRAEPQLSEHTVDALSCSAHLAGFAQGPGEPPRQIGGFVPPHLPQRDSRNLPDRCHDGQRDPSMQIARYDQRRPSPTGALDPQPRTPRD